MWGRLCRAAGIQNQQDLPFIHGMYDDKQNKHLVCFAHICGFCWPAEQNNCRFIPGHLSADRIPDGYARALRDKLAPGIKWMLDNRDQVLRDAAAEKQARKRQKRNPKGGGADGRTLATPSNANRGVGVIGKHCRGDLGEHSPSD